jgi:hypothetical protein
VCNGLGLMYSVRVSPDAGLLRGCPSMLVYWEGDPQCWSTERATLYAGRSTERVTLYAGLLRRWPSMLVHWDHISLVYYDCLILTASYISHVHLWNSCTCVHTYTHTRFAGHMTMTILLRQLVNGLAARLGEHIVLTTVCTPRHCFNSPGRRDNTSPGVSFEE